MVVMKLRNYMKKIAAAALVGVMTLSMAACGGSGSSSETGGTGEGGLPAEVTEKGITITLWHNRGTGANGTEMEKAVKAFNESNEYGITVNSEYIGATATILSKAVTSIAAGNNPTMVMLDNCGVPTLAEKGALADLSGYVERDGFDMDNIVEQMREYVYHGEKVVSFPYTRSTVVMYYNKALFAKAGVEVPKSIEELEQVGPVLTQKLGIPAYCLLIDASFYQESLLQSIGKSGSLNADGTGTDILDNGSMATLLKDWKSWVDAGWCAAPAVTNSETAMTEDFYQGKVASMILSTGTYQNVTSYSADNGIDLGVAPNIGYGGYATAGGGGNIAVIEKNSSQQQIAAAWEFIKFLMADEQVASNSINTGYLPVTYSAADSEQMQSHWAAEPEAKVAYDQLQYSTEPSWAINRSEWNTQIKTAISYVIQDGSQTVDQAIDYLKKQEKIIFGN